MPNSSSTFPSSPPPRVRVRRTLAFVLLFTVFSACPQGARTVLVGAGVAATGTGPDTPDPGPVEDLAASIAPRHAPERERAHAIYRWIAQHVDYDVYLLVSGEALAPTTPEEVLERRLAVCNGYAMLYQALAAAAGLESVVIEGWAKGIASLRPSRRPNHAWVAVRVDGRWVLVDPTWGAGYIAEGRFVRSYTDEWFDVDPMRLRFTHHPKDSRWQLARRRISRRDFDALPAARPELFRLAVDPARLEREARNHRITALPDAYPLDRHTVELREAPLSGLLDSRRTYRLSVIAKHGAEAFISQNGRRLPLRRGELRDEFVTELQPAAGQLTLFVRFENEPERLYPVLSYHAH